MSDKLNKWPDIVAKDCEPYQMLKTDPDSLVSIEGVRIWSHSPIKLELKLTIKVRLPNSNQVKRFGNIELFRFLACDLTFFGRVCEKLFATIQKEVVEEKEVLIPKFYTQLGLFLGAKLCHQEFVQGQDHENEFLEKVKKF